MNYKETMLFVENMLDDLRTYQLEAIDAGAFSVDSKSSTVDMVTDIDLKSEEKIKATIHGKFPDHIVLGEESGVSEHESDYMWVIDPIDGTTNFVHGYPMHCISVGLKYKGETILGAVDAPILKMRFTAIIGQGAKLNGNPIHVSKTDALGQAVIATGFPYSRKTDNMNLPYFMKVVNDVAGIRRSGSAALDLCMVAAGMLDGYWEFALNEWDICAGVILIREAGGIVTKHPMGKDTMLISGNKDIHNQLKDQLFS